MEKTAATRQRLLILKGQHTVIMKGLDLLKSKREALMKEFFGIIEESVRMRDKLTGMLSTAQRNLEKVRALQGPSVESFAHAAKRDISIDIRLRNVWGVNVPEIEEKPLVRSLDARDVSPIGESASILDAAKEFETSADLLLKIASRETRLQRVGEMIKADTRKINAITEFILPSMGRSIKYIERTLEEREREEVFRLKRYKTKKEPYR